jgi:hydrogenase expression/formation protein HypE
MELGKFSSEKLNEIIISKINHKRQEVVLSASVGEDCAAIDIKDKLCVVSTDPITGAAANVGRLSVHVSVNDVASSGAEPVGILVTLLAPPSATFADVEKVIDEISETCDELNLDIVGGHTEVTDAVTRIVVSTTVLGQCRADKLVTSSGARPGDAIVVTKYVAMEGTAIIAQDYEDRLSGVLTPEQLKKAKALIGNLSVLTEGLVAAEFGATAMHDITEGGVFGAVHEICQAAGIGAVVNTADIPLMAETRAICAHLRLNPYRLISSGSMLITLPKPEPLIAALKTRGILATEIGRMTETGIIATQNGQTEPIAPPQADELFRL